MLLIKNGRVYTMKKENGFDGFVLIEDDKIKKVGSSDELTAEAEAKCKS